MKKEWSVSKFTMDVSALFIRLTAFFVRITASSSFISFVYFTELHLFHYRRIHIVQGCFSILVSLLQYSFKAISHQLYIRKFYVITKHIFNYVLLSVQNYKPYRGTWVSVTEGNWIAQFCAPRSPLVLNSAVILTNITPGFEIYGPYWNIICWHLQRVIYNYSLVFSISISVFSYRYLLISTQRVLITDILTSHRISYISVSLSYTLY